MPGRLISQNATLRARLRFIARYGNLSVTRRLKRNFTRMAQSDRAELRRLLETTYLPSWFSGVDITQFVSSPEGEKAFRSHLFYRLEMDRYELIP